MPMNIVSSVIDGSIVVVGAVGALVAFVASLKGFEAPIVTNVGSAAEKAGATFKRVA